MSGISKEKSIYEKKGKQTRKTPGEGIGEGQQGRVRDKGVEEKRKI